MAIHNGVNEVTNSLQQIYQSLQSPTRVDADGERDAGLESWGRRLVLLGPTTEPIPNFGDRRNT